jgi:hypothetical protein
MAKTTQNDSGSSGEAGRPQEEGTISDTMRCAELSFSQTRKTSAGRLRDGVKSSQDFTYAAAPFD